MPVHFKNQAQIKAQSGAKVGALIFDEALIAVLAKYFNYSNPFSAEYAVELLEYTRMNDHAVKLKEG